MLLKLSCLPSLYAPGHSRSILRTGSCDYDVRGCSDAIPASAIIRHVWAVDGEPGYVWPVTWESAIATAVTESYSTGIY